MSPRKEPYCAYWRMQLLPRDLIFNCLPNGFYTQKMLPNLIIRIFFHQKYKLNNEILLLHECCYISKSYYYMEISVRQDYICSSWWLKISPAHPFSINFFFLSISGRYSMLVPHTEVVANQKSFIRLNKDY